MATCPTCHQPANTRDGFDRRGRQRFACHPCHRDFTHASSGAFSGYRWPPEVIVTAVRRRHRRRLGRRWSIDEVFLLNGTVKRYLYRAVDERGQVVD